MTDKMTPEMRRRMKAIALSRSTPQQEAAYYMNQYLNVLHDGEMDEQTQKHLANYYLGIYYMILDEIE